MFTSPSQILCTIFGVNIYYYGVIMALAIATGVLVADWAGTKYFGLKKETIIDLAPYIIIFGILGARIYYCALNYGFYLRFPTEIIAIRHFHFLNQYRLEMHLQKYTSLTIIVYLTQLLRAYS